MTTLTALPWCLPLIYLLSAIPAFLLKQDTAWRIAERAAAAALLIACVVPALAVLNRAAQALRVDHVGMIMALLIALLGLSASGWYGVMVAEHARLAGPARAGAVTGAALLFGYAGLALAPPGFAVLGGALGTATAFALPLAATAALGARLLWAADRRTA